MLAFPVLVVWEPERLILKSEYTLMKNIHTNDYDHFLENDSYCVGCKLRGEN